MKDLQIKKLYYSISEVSKMVGLAQYVLRYWETEFEQLRPQKNRAGNRIYTEKDIEVIKLIKKLTREQKYTIEGARQVLGKMSFENGTPVIEDLTDEAGEEASVAETPTMHRELKELRTTLVELLNKLDPGSNR